ncbi:uncharacterized protein LOC111333824 [Stylophora pistillata]|nr:uncharacterized protein LOC111333824 [Stylophora pistillata]
MTVMPGYQGTPKPIMYVGRKVSSPDAFSQWLLAMGLASPPNPPVVLNSLRYDDNTHVVTFHLREEDWNEHNCASTIWISSDELISVINCEPVSLGDENVQSVERVDPVETFGLFARQTFTVVESNEKCQALKVLKVEENIHFYSAELEILD